MAFIPAAEPLRGPRRLSIPFMMAAMLMVAAALALPPPAWAADEVFTVANVSVDATAATAAAARERAIQDGQRRAFDRLLQRLTPAAERPRLPRLSDTAVADLVRDFEISGEKTSSVRYIAELTVRFKPAEVRNILRQRGLAFAETPSKPVLVLPVYYAAAAGAVLFEDNPWRAAWAKLAPGDGLVPFLLPRDDAADMAAITPAQAEAGDATALRAIAARYGAADVLVAVARAHPDAATGREALNVSTSRFGAATEQSVVSAFAPEANDASADAVYDRAAATVAERVEESWKQASLLRFDSQQEISVRVPLEGLDSLVTIMRGLDGLAPIQRVDLVRVARDEAEVRLQFVGDTDQLALLLAQRDLALRREADGFVLQSTATGRAGGPQ